MLQVAARLRTSGPAIGAPVLTVQLTDAAGVAYQVTAGSLPADGRRHLLTAVLAPRHRADYPLRLTGYFLEYLQKGRKPVQASLAIGPVRGTAGPGSGAIAAVPPGRPLTTVTDDSAAAPTSADVRAGGPAWW